MATLTKVKTTYIATLYNSADCELDYFSADDITTLRIHLGKRAAGGSWLLNPGDTIKIGTHEHFEAR